VRSVTAAVAAAPVASANRRLSLVTVDQGISSLSNIIALIWVAHMFGPVGFGRFSLITMIYSVAQISFRGLISTTVLVHPEDADERPRDVLSSTTLLGLVAGGVCSLSGLGMLSLGSSLGGPTLALGIAMPLLMLQDVGRYLAIARRRPTAAIVLDSLWLLLMAGAFIAIRVLDKSSLTWVVGAWTGTGAISALWVFVQYGPPSTTWLSWVRERWNFSWRSLVSSIAASGTTLLTASLMTAFSSAIAVAAFRAATLLGAPSTTVQMAVGTSAAADIARDRDDKRSVANHVRRAIAVSTAVGVLNLVVLVFLPNPIGHAVLGDSWDTVKPLMLALSLKVLLMAAQSGIRASLIGRRLITPAMVTDVISIILVGVCMIVGAALGDAEGALWAMAVGTGVSTCCWWIALWWTARPTRPAPRHAVATSGALR
jgi:O-antigen/teichoic acid export membrane protein